MVRPRRLYFAPAIIHDRAVGSVEDNGYYEARQPAAKREVWRAARPPRSPAYERHNKSGRLGLDTAQPQTPALPMQCSALQRDRLRAGRAGRLAAAGLLAHDAVAHDRNVRLGAVGQLALE